MSDKYIIKNCPASSKDFRLNCQGKAYIDKYKCVYGLLECQDCTDCKLKQIVELCKEIKCPCEFKGADCWECTESGARRLADKILQLLDIQEVE